MIDVTTSLEVATLGRFEVRRKADLLTGGNWSRRKVVELFKLLLSVEQHRLHREQVQELLWPNSPLEQASNSFGKTLYLLRRALEPDLAAGKGGSSIYLLLDRDTLMLLPNTIRIDADAFEAASRQLQARMRNRTGKETEDEYDALLDAFDAALALYQGDYLPEDLYDDWAQRRRDRLRRVHSWLLENAAELAIASGKGQRAIEYLLDLLEHNPADEQTHRQLMLVYARIGRRSEALNQYILLRKALKEDLRAAPLPESNDLFKRIQMGQVPVDLRQSRVESVPLRAKSEQLEDASPLAEKQSQPLQADTAQRAIRPAARVEAQEQETPGRADPDRILRAGLVGREEEIASMQHAFMQARRGQPRVVFISGEPGIGKSRLAYEFARWGEENRQATALRGYCYEMSGALPYQPIADALAAHTRASSPEKLRAMLGESALHLAKIIPEIRLKLPDLPQPESLAPEAERRNLYSAVARYLDALASEQPLLLVLDDLQWADAATTQLLNYLTLQRGGNPFDAAESAQAQPAPLYLLLYRSGEVPEAHPLRSFIATLTRAGLVEELRLQRLDEAQVLQLLINMAGHSINPAFAGEIYRQTEGNPFFVGEVVRSLLLEGKIAWNGERWQSTVKLSELDIPQSVRLVIERRMVNLSPECRVTLTLAAVMGRDFSSALLSQAHTIAEETLAEHIDQAIQLQILAPRFDLSGGRISPVTPHLMQGQTDAQQALLQSYRQDIDLTFTHDKIREVLYQWLNPLRRRALHRQVAQAIEKRYASYLRPYYSQLGYHYQMAEEYGKAVDYFLLAAEQAAAVYAYVDAAYYVTSALELLIGDNERPRRAALLHRLANLYLYVGRLDESMRCGLASAAIWRDLGDAVKQAEAYLEVAFCCHWQGRERDSIKHIHSALDCISGRKDQTALLAKAYAQWGLAATVRGDAPEALEKLRQADALHTEIGGGDAFISVVSLWSLAWCYCLTETPREMLEYALKGAEVCVTSHHPEWEPMMKYSAAWAYMLMGRISEGIQAAQDALNRAQYHGVFGAQGWANLMLAFLAIQTANWEDAKRFGDQAYAIAEMLQDVDLQARVLWSRSVCAGWQGQWKDAITHILAALELAGKDGETSLVYPHLLVQAARTYFYDGQHERAQRYLDEGMQLAKEREYRQIPAIAARLQGRILQAEDRFDDAQPYFEQSLAQLQALGDIIEYARSEEAYGLFFLERDREGDMERGQALLDSARETYRRLGVNG